MISRSGQVVRTSTCRLLYLAAIVVLLALSSCTKPYYVGGKEFHLRSWQQEEAQEYLAGSPLGWDDDGLIAKCHYWRRVAKEAEQYDGTALGAFVRENETSFCRDAAVVLAERRAKKNLAEEERQKKAAEEARRAEEAMRVEEARRAAAAAEVRQDERRARACLEGDSQDLCSKYLQNCKLVSQLAFDTPGTICGARQQVEGRLKQLRADEADTLLMEALAENPKDAQRSGGYLKTCQDIPCQRGEIAIGVVVGAKGARSDDYRAGLSYCAASRLCEAHVIFELTKKLDRAIAAEEEMERKRILADEREARLYERERERETRAAEQKRLREAAAADRLARKRATQAQARERAEARRQQEAAQRRRVGHASCKGVSVAYNDVRGKYDGSYYEVAWIRNRTNLGKEVMVGVMTRNGLDVVQQYTVRQFVRPQSEESVRLFSEKPNCWRPSTCYDVLEVWLDYCD